MGMICDRCGVPLREGDPILAGGPPHDRTECHLDCDHPGVDPRKIKTLDSARSRELSRAAKHVVTWTEKRNELIRDALASGAGVREVARATSLAPATVLNIQTPKKRGTP